MPAACKVDYVALASAHPMWPTHKTSSLLCQPQQQARKHLAQCATCGICHTAPNDQSLQALQLAAEAAAAAAAVVQVVAQWAAAPVLQHLPEASGAALRAQSRLSLEEFNRLHSESAPMLGTARRAADRQVTVAMTCNDSLMMGAAITSAC